MTLHNDQPYSKQLLEIPESWHNRWKYLARILDEIQKRLDDIELSIEELKRNETKTI